MRLNILFGIALGLAAPTAAQRTEAPATLLPAVQTALDRGALLYLFDEAAWHGSDDLVAHHNALLPLVGGYVVSGDQADVELAFYDKALAKALYRAKFSSGKMIASGPPAPGREALSPIEHRLVVARAIALKAFKNANVSTCAKGAPNVALLPSPVASGPVRAYLLTPRTTMKALPLGGHYEVDVALDGTAGAVRAFTKSCLEMPMTGDAKGKPMAIVISHLLDPTPTEIHVFSSLTGKIPIYVLTTINQKLWRVSADKIELLPSRLKASQ